MANMDDIIKEQQAEKMKGLDQIRRERDSFRTTLRDQFAMNVISGFAGNSAIFAPNPMSGWDLVNCDYNQLCQTAYGLADVMIAVREGE